VGGTRTYASFSDASQESTDSRIWGGIHFRFDSVAGQLVGNNVADYVFDNYFQPDGHRRAVGVDVALAVAAVPLGAPEVVNNRDVIGHWMPTDNAERKQALPPVRDPNGKGNSANARVNAVFDAQRKNSDSPAETDSDFVFGSPELWLELFGPAV
jgi:hypothetical protein